MANISITGGTLVSNIPVEKEREEVIETIAAVNEGNASVKGGTLVMKSMKQIARESVPETTATESLAEPFRQPIAQEGESLRPKVRPERPNVEVKELPDAPKPDIAADEVRPTDGKDIKPTEMREGIFSSAVESGWNIISEGLGVNRETWDIFKEEIAKIESKGSGDYQAIGGDNDNYDGKYQMGRMAKADAGSLLGIDINHDEESRYSFRQNPALQERAFAAYTLRNHQYMMSNPIYQNLSPEQQITVLAYAHNQGHGGAKALLNKGEVRKDAFGTQATKYSDALSNRLSVSLPEPPASAGKTISESLRPKVRPEQ